MKLISLNTWGGKIYHPLIKFIRENSKNTDIFCLQEIYNTSSNIKQYKGIRANLLKQFEDLLNNFQIFYFPVLEGYDDEPIHIDFALTTGSAFFVKKSIKIISENNYFIYRDQNFKALKKDFSNLPTPLMYINFKVYNREFSVFNFHGSPFPSNKLDSENKLKEARKVKKIMDSKSGAKIITGDFNLLPETKSLKIISDGMKNLIEEFEVERTRSNLSPYYGRGDFQKFADYVFVSDDIKVVDFKVLETEVSDHLPMILEFS